MADLPLEQRAVFSAFELDGLSCAEIAQALQIPVGTVYSRLRLAREDLKQRLAVIELLARSGQREAARASARAFMKAFPESSLRARVRELAE